MRDFWYNFKEQFRRNPVLFILIGLIFFRSVLGAGSIFNWLYSKLLILPGIIIGLCAHEASHAFASYKLGDYTPKAQGRLTLDPRAHIDFWGFFFLIFSGFGWGKPVQVDSRYYKNKKVGEIIVSISGVLANITIAILFTFLYKILVYRVGMDNIITDMIMYAIQINIVLFIFNLLPCPPLDGWNLISSIFNLQKYDWWWKIYSKQFLILLIFIILNIPDIAISYFGGLILHLLF